MVCADNSDFNAQVQKAKTDGLPTAELTELFEKLLDEDRKLEDRLGNQVSAAEDAIKALEKQKEAVEAYRQTKENLDKLSDEELAFWQRVRDTCAAIGGKPSKKYSAEALTKWYNGLHTDSAEYKMWGNGIALPCAAFVLEGIAEALMEENP